MSVRRRLANVLFAAAQRLDRPERGDVYEFVYDQRIDYPSVRASTSIHADDKSRVYGSFKRELSYTYASLQVENGGGGIVIHPSRRTTDQMLNVLRGIADGYARCGEDR